MLTYVHVRKARASYTCIRVYEVDLSTHVNRIWWTPTPYRTFVGSIRSHQRLYNLMMLLCECHRNGQCQQTCLVCSNALRRI